MCYYHTKYLKYKTKYIKLLHGGVNNIIIHIAGPQGSGKSFMGTKLMSDYGDLIYVKDLDILWDEFTKSNEKNYQIYIDNYIKKHNDKPLIFVGLDATLCLGPKDNNENDKNDDKETDPKNGYFNFNAKYRFYIKNPTEQTLQQRFFRQIDKLNQRKEIMFEQYLINPKKIQDKLIRFVNISEWTKNMEECDELYLKRNYKLLPFDDIYEKIKEELKIKPNV